MFKALIVQNYAWYIGVWGRDEIRGKKRLVEQETLDRYGSYMGPPPHLHALFCASFGKKLIENKIK